MRLTFVRANPAFVWAAPRRDNYIDSHVAYVRPYFGPASSSSQTQPTPWAPAGLGTQISGGILKTGTVIAEKLAVTQLSAITADVGLLRTSATGERTEIQANQIRCYDAANTLRVLIGRL